MGLTTLTVEKLKPLDIIVTRDRSPVSWWIRVKSVSEWSHVCLAGENATVYTTGVLGFKHLPAYDFLNGKTFEVYRFESLSQAQNIYGIRLCDQQLSKPYAYSDLLSMVLQNYLGHGIKSLKRNSKNFFCSEFVAYVFQQMGVKLAPQKHKEPSGYTPNDCIEDERLTLVTL